MMEYYNRSHLLPFLCISRRSPSSDEITITSFRPAKNHAMIICLNLRDDANARIRKLETE